MNSTSPHAGRNYRNKFINILKPNCKNIKCCTLIANLRGHVAQGIAWHCGKGVSARDRPDPAMSVKPRLNASKDAPAAVATTATWSTLDQHMAEPVTLGHTPPEGEKALVANGGNNAKGADEDSDAGPRYHP
eukprot:3728364-Amphidinium_carterae.3